MKRRAPSLRLLKNSGLVLHSLGSVRETPGLVLEVSWTFSSLASVEWWNDCSGDAFQLLS